MRQGLCLHCGASAATLDQVHSIETPEPAYRGEKGKRMFYPTSHGSIVTTVKNRLADLGFKTNEEAYALTHAGQEFFGLISLIRNDSAPIVADHDLIIGLRNAHNGRFPISLALGARVFVCDNLSFSGEVEVSRKHSRYAGEDMPGLISAALGELGAVKIDQAKRFAAYKSRALLPERAHSLILRSFQHNVIGAQQIVKVLEEYENPKHEDFRAGNVWSLYNAFTEQFKPKEGAQTNLIALPKATNRLHGLLDAFCGLQLA